MAKYEYTEEMVADIHTQCADEVTEEVIVNLCDTFEFPRRSITAKLRKLGYDVPKKPGEAPAFDAAETEALKQFLSDNDGTLTSQEVADQFMDGKFTSRQINGKVLSMEMTDNLKKTEKKVVPKSYSDEESSTVQTMAEDGAFIEEIAAKVSKSVASVRGKLLSLGLTAPQKEKAVAKPGAYDGIEAVAAEMTVAELAEKYEKSERGVKTVLSKRKLVCKDYTPKNMAE